MKPHVEYYTKTSVAFHGVFHVADFLANYNSCRISHCISHLPKGGYCVALMMNFMEHYMDNFMVYFMAYFKAHSVVYYMAHLMANFTHVANFNGCIIFHSSG